MLKPQCTSDERLVANSERRPMNKHLSTGHPHEWAWFLHSPRGQILPLSGVYRQAVKLPLSRARWRPRECGLRGPQTQAAHSPAPQVRVTQGEEVAIQGYLTR